MDHARSETRARVARGSSSEEVASTQQNPSRSTFKSRPESVGPALGKPNQSESTRKTEADRLQEVLALNKHQDSEAINGLVLALADPEHNIRWLAGSSLIHRASADVVSAISAFLDKAESEQVKRARPEAERVLGMIAVAAEEEEVRVAASKLLISM
jgi:HEAT repeat protein